VDAAPKISMFYYKFRYFQAISQAKNRFSEQIYKKFRFFSGNFRKKFSRQI